MIGNVVNDGQMKELIERRFISIEGFSEKKIDTIHYPLTSRAIYKIDGRTPDGRSRPRMLHGVGHGSETFEFEPRQSLLIQIEEIVTVKSGIVAQFSTPFSMVDRGFQLNAGRMRAPFGEGNERLVFGVTNLLDTRNLFAYRDPVAYIYFFDLRGLKSLTDFTVSKEELARLDILMRRYRRDNDDGVRYDADHD
jgi:hypothetical protein